MSMRQRKQRFCQRFDHRDFYIGPCSSMWFFEREYGDRKWGGHLTNFAGVPR